MQTTDAATRRHAKRLGALLALLPAVRDRHAPGDPLYRLLKDVARDSVEACFSGETAAPVTLPPFGALTFPYHRMGNIDSLDLFGLDELIILSFYWANRGRYRRAVDFGANIGLHSFAMSRAGFKVRSFEPDPVHFRRLEATLADNGCASVECYQAAVSIADGGHEFVRVLGNTTGSHLAGAKPNPYGELERITVRLEAAAPNLEWADLAKIDIEGHEADMLCGVPLDAWSGTDAVVEVGNQTNAGRIFDHFAPSGIALFAQKIAWGQVTERWHMPESHRDGSLFLTAKTAMPWE